MAELSREQAKLLIHGANLRATAPRVAVLRLLSAVSKPVSHSEVVESIGSEDWDQATLYRNLLKLVEANLARVASKVDGVSRYEARGEHDGPHQHPHFSCRTCGEVECLPNTTLAGSVDRGWDRSIGNAELQLIGDCPSCLSGKDDSKASGDPPKNRQRTISGRRENKSRR